MDRDLVEKLEVLDGSRNRASLERAAVRIEDLAALLAIDTSTTATPAAGFAPTAQEFDALVEDVRAMRQSLATIADALRRKTSP